MSRGARSLAAALLIGLLLGAAGGAWWQRRTIRDYMRRGPNAERIMNKLNRELDLDESQKAQVQAILSKKMGEIEKLHEDARSKFESVRTETRQEIGAVLKPDQQKKYADLTARWEERHKHWWGEPGGAK